jgi:Chaperone of endosialidase
MGNRPVGPNGPGCVTITSTPPTCPGNLPIASDRNVKKDIVPADTAAILAKVSKLPISTWTYKSEADGLRHLGPMAQDFRASFGLGDDEHYYYPVDAHGVALASIQALDRLVQLQQEQIRKLERQNANLARRLGQIEKHAPAQNHP